MYLRMRTRRTESYEELRVRMIAETSAFLTECIQHPEFGVRIPTIPAESERFPPSFSMSFWDPVLLD
jgi:hypothetical protein